MEAALRMSNSSAVEISGSALPDSDSGVVKADIASEPLYIALTVTST